MDPNTALTTMLDTSAEPEERRDAANALRGWLRSGGYPPTNTPTASGYKTRGALLMRCSILISSTLAELEQVTR